MGIYEKDAVHISAKVVKIGSVDAGHGHMGKEDISGESWDSPNKFMEIAGTLTEIHNENFMGKVGNGYFSDILLNEAYTVYCIITEEGSLGDIEKKIREDSKEERLEAGGMLCYDVLGYAIFYDTSASIDLFEIAIRKSWHSKGLGNELLKKSICAISGETWIKSRSTEDRKIFLEVREGNLSAIRVYKKNGFEKVSLRKGYYGKGEDAIIMVKEISI